MPTETSNVTLLEGLDILGPNPLVGLSPADILETMQRITGGVLRSPQAALNREMDFGTHAALNSGRRCRN